MLSGSIENAAMDNIRSYLQLYLIPISWRLPLKEILSLPFSSLFMFITSDLIISQINIIYEYMHVFIS